MSINKWWTNQSQYSAGWQQNITEWNDDMWWLTSVCSILSWIMFLFSFLQNIPPVYILWAEHYQSWVWGAQQLTVSGGQQSAVYHVRTLIILSQDGSCGGGKWWECEYFSLFLSVTVWDWWREVLGPWSSSSWLAGQSWPRSPATGPVCVATPLKSST